jgi:hypothetical protein
MLEIIIFIDKLSFLVFLALIDELLTALILLTDLKKPVE